ncbi:MAG: EF-hand domain-containing protein [Akkermansiaceae bacterium]|nr:EF-hand domain-containing protein [Akkermansiaceae bacterium]
MVRTLFIILALMTLNSSGFIGFEADPKKGGDKPERGGERPSSQDMVKRLDADKNGEISFTEFSAGKRIQSLDEGVRKKIFDRLDKDSNGVISKNDLRRPHEPKGPHGGFVFPPFEKMDANKDRQVGIEEFSNSPKFKEMPPERVRRIFDQMDRNKDGFLSRKDHSKLGHDRRGKKGGRPDGGMKNPDTNGDNKVSREEFQKSPFALGMPEEARQKLFQKLDKNADGFLDSSELREPRKKGPKK